MLAWPRRAGFHSPGDSKRNRDRERERERETVSPTGQQTDTKLTQVDSLARYIPGVGGRVGGIHSLGIELSRGGPSGVEAPWKKRKKKKKKRRESESERNEGREATWLRPVYARARNGKS